MNNIEEKLEKIRLLKKEIKGIHLVISIKDNKYTCRFPNDKVSLYSITFEVLLDKIIKYIVENREIVNQYYNRKYIYKGITTIKRTKYKSKFKYKIIHNGKKKGTTVT